MNEPKRKEEGALPEITAKAVVLGVLLSTILAAANAYLGLKVGMTVSASIPTAVISMGVLSLFRQHNILENNIVQTAASAGESVAAGVIFVIPALVMIGAWDHFDTVQITVIAGLGGLLGVLFTVPLRRALIVPGDLKFPEGVATASVLRAGEGGGGIMTIVIAGIVGGIAKLGSAGLYIWASTAETARRVGKSVLYFGSDLSPALLSVGYIVRLNIAALVFIGGFISWHIAIPAYHAAHEEDFRPRVDGIGGAFVEETGSNFGGYEIVAPHSVRRPDRDLGLRYEPESDRLVIFDFRSQEVVFDNGAQPPIDTGLVAVSGEASSQAHAIGVPGADPTTWDPVEIHLRGSATETEEVSPFVPWGRLGAEQLVLRTDTRVPYGDAGTSSEYLAVADAAWEIWTTRIRYLGVGAMVIGGLWALISLFGPIRDGIREGLRAVRSGASEDTPREDRDMPMTWVLALLGVASVALFLLYQGFVKNVGISLPMAIIMLVGGFFFSAVAGYMAGLVGSSNNPISGVTIATILFASLLLFLLMGSDAGTEGAAAALIGAVVCCAAAIAGDNMQDLKTGHIVGATPWKQQVMQSVGVVSAAVVMAPVLQLLMKAYGFVGASTPEQLDPLAAPQAGLMASVAQGVFDQSLPWNFILAGVGIGAFFIALDTILTKREASFRTPVLAVAVGIYLPFELAVPILIGGAIGHIADRSTRRDPEAAHRGLLVASGLITGEALIGIAMAIAIAGSGKADIFAIRDTPFAGLGVLLMLGIAAYIYVSATQRTIRVEGADA